MNSFLESIAQVYYKNERQYLDNYCFVFPNKRSGTFFRHYLQKCNAGNAPMFEPEITTISEFVSNFSNSVEADRYDLLFTLYNEYKKLSGNDEDFDRFVYWGDILIGDFNDVDRYLADPHRIFKNITDVKEISTDFLTDEQKDIIKRYWGVDLSHTNSEEFWKHINKNEGNRKNRESFVKLWEILDELYHKFKNKLSENGLCFSGMQYREVADFFKNADKEDIPYDRIIFVGFNVLSTSEIKIFESLNKLGIADFYWDYNLPKDVKEYSSATHFIRKYTTVFKSKYSEETSCEIDELPKITVLNVPSNVGQVKMTGEILTELRKAGNTDATNAIDTAIVLPDEDLFIDLLHSIPEEYSNVNITMGYPLRMTPVATFLHNVITLHLRARKMQDIWYFFYEDVKSIITHPILNAFAAEECRALKNDIERYRMFNISVDYIADGHPELAVVFKPLTNLQSSSDVFKYIRNLIDFLIGKSRQEESDDDEAKPMSAPDIGFLIRYKQSIDKLEIATNKYGISLRESTMFHLIERTLNSETANFTGEPLSGLQIMGVLETRALDFKNIIMLSMNERIFPRRHYSRSLIPNNIRKWYGLSTTEFQECIYSYYFFRLISRAENVTLIYDGRTSGIKGGEMSRYIYQLIYIYKCRELKLRQATFITPALASNPKVDVEKDERIMAEVNRFLTNDKDTKRYLSPSAINEYLSCPLKFYFNYIEKTRTEEEITDYMDESVFGQIVHRVLELSYESLQGKIIDPDALDNLAKDKIALEKRITSSINEIYKKLPNQNSTGDRTKYYNYTALSGEAQILGELIKEIVSILFKQEKKIAEISPFEFLSGEEKIKTGIDIGDGQVFNIKGTIDRVDRVNPESENSYIRIIDYKTGSDEIKVSNIDNITHDLGTRPHNKAVLQLFLYCNMYKNYKNYHGKIKPMIYNIKRIATNSLEPIQIEKEELEDYRSFNDGVMNKFKERIKGLFDKETPFSPTPSEKACKYCDYKDLCEQSND